MLCHAALCALLRGGAPILTVEPTPAWPERVPAPRHCCPSRSCSLPPSLPPSPFLPSSLPLLSLSLSVTAPNHFRSISVRVQSVPGLRSFGNEFAAARPFAHALPVSREATRMVTRCVALETRYPCTENPGTHTRVSTVHTHTRTLVSQTSSTGTQHSVCNPHETEQEEKLTGFRQHVTARQKTQAAP
eukprot:503842-Rhodomonas_salina.1